jgi:exodeoxyribonuclease VII small subunit
MDKEENLTFSQAMTELDIIVKGIEDGKIGIDELSDRVKRASQLILFCRTKISETRAEVNRIIEGLKPEDVPLEAAQKLPKAGLPDKRAQA